MGAATARMFAREGAKVVIADVLEHEGRQVADAIGASARFEPLDVTKGEDWGERIKTPPECALSALNVRRWQFSTSLNLVSAVCARFLVERIVFDRRDVAG
jgi:NAD(P)-dependent dehydrogenase (short-subunit alcohol dehydrogenase family)